ncbi:nucleoside hydrolase [Actinosynnema pretiosum subsp. pretiosum]|uniref:Inosine/uridine-preferring nucleoside hydrolase n=2 Tax=Actinosynnema TaxID=40566 RepID=C6WMM7_ACTMD|nr:nucleoside hydrolase [Actinosynnema mirum]ACU36556.1 Inosine/uridine-preferring nucleoside hydrolase [Actinosynnema mirum DSM 43827]QUF05811.1 nucleoside hydrolase [Actinosynnema pretiosum subsp. pretiosum]
MRIVLDTDPGVDDALAILYLAAHLDEAELVAVGSVHGNVPAPQAALNALRVLELAGLGGVPVAVGARRPLAQPLYTSEFVHGLDGLGGRAGPPPSRLPVPVSAAEQLVALARANPGELTLIALGPLTNLALAVLLEPELPALLRSVTAMAGATAVPGNITPYAEANAWHDPEAAAIVLDAGFDLTLVGLEVTESARADADWLDRLAGLRTRRARYANAILAHYVEFYTRVIGRRTCTPHDPLTVAVALDPGLATHRELPLGVELTGTHTRGQIVADRRRITTTAHIESTIDDTPRPVKVLRTVQSEVFLERLLEALARPD